MTPVERVERLVAAGNIAPEEGARLLAAMSNAPKRSAFYWLLNPFERFGGGVAAGAGALISALSIAASRLGIRFDGLLDMHIVRPSVPKLQVAVADQIVGWLFPALCFWAVARMLTRHVRLLDFVGMVGLARLPLLLCALAVVGLPQPSATSVRLTPALLVIATLAIVALVTNITLLYQGFKNASGLRGARLVGSFIATVIVTELLSKLVLFVS